MKSHDSWEKAVRCAQSALEKKAYDLVLLEVTEQTTVTDYFILCTGRSSLQVQSICREIEESLRRAGMRPLAVEGFNHGQWILMDFGDVVVHIFYETVREFYNLDGLWANAPQCTLPEPYQTQAEDLRIATG